MSSTSESSRVSVIVTFESPCLGVCGAHAHGRAVCAAREHAHALAGERGARPRCSVGGGGYDGGFVGVVREKDLGLVEHALSEVLGVCA